MPLIAYNAMTLWADEKYFFDFQVQFQSFQSKIALSKASNKIYHCRVVLHSVSLCAAVSVSQNVVNAMVVWKRVYSKGCIFWHMLTSQTFTMNGIGFGNCRVVYVSK